MTVLVGVKCTNGVVIGADSAATSAAGNIHLLKMASDKIVIVDGRVIVAGTGQVGMGQRFAAIVKAAHGAKLFQKSTVEVMKALSAQGGQDFASTGASKGVYGALLAAPVEAVGQLVEFAVSDFQPEIKTEKLHFVAMGSGQMLAEPFISFVSRAFWRSKVPDVQSAIFGVHWTLAHTIACAPGGVGDPIAIATLTNPGGGNGGWKAELLSEAELGEQREHMAAIEEHIATYKEALLGDVAAEEVPKPNQ